MKKIHFVSIVMFVGIVLFVGCNTSNTSERKQTDVPTISPFPTPMLTQAEHATPVPEVTQSIFTEPSYRKLTSEEMQEMLSNDVMRYTSLIIDVRSQEEYDEGHIKDALLVPEYEIDKKVGDYPRTTNILVYCQTGEKSKSIAKKLIGLGFEKVYDLGGIIDWTGKIVGNRQNQAYYNCFTDTLPQDTVTPIEYTISKKVARVDIDNQLPEYTFHLTGSSIKHYKILEDSTKRHIMFYENKIETITITDSRGAIVQKMEGLVTSNPAFPDEMYGLSFDDWNFDGYLDLDLWSSPEVSTRSGIHYYWLWDNDLGQFVANEHLIELSRFFVLGINTEENWIVCSQGTKNPYDYTTQYMYYVNGSFILSFIEISKIEPSPNEEGKYVRHVIEQRFNGGKWSISSNNYYDIQNPPSQ